MIATGTLATGGLPGLVAVDASFTGQPPLEYTILRNTTR
jgi:hypothetical protein